MLHTHEPVTYMLPFLGQIWSEYWQCNINVTASSHLIWSDAFRPQHPQWTRVLLSSAVFLIPVFVFRGHLMMVLWSACFFSWCSPEANWAATRGWKVNDVWLIDWLPVAMDTFQNALLIIKALCFVFSRAEASFFIFTAILVKAKCLHICVRDGVLKAPLFTQDILETFHLWFSERQFTWTGV